MKRHFKSGPVDCRLQPWIAEDGTPFLAFCTSMQLPKGVKIVGNGTIPHPLNVELSGVYGLAPEMLKLLRDCAEAFRDTAERDGGTLYQKAHSAYDAIWALLAKVDANKP